MMICYPVLKGTIQLEELSTCLFIAVQSFTCLRIASYGNDFTHNIWSCHLLACLFCSMMFGNKLAMFWRLKRDITKVVNSVPNKNRWHLVRNSQVSFHNLGVSIYVLKVSDPVLSSWIVKYSRLEKIIVKHYLQNFE